MKVRNNVASLNSLRHANENFNRVSDSVEKLSSGMKINRAKDAPANLIASERFRGNIAGLKQSHSNTEMAMTIYQQAEGSLNEISDILVRLKQLSVHAANEAVNDDAMLAADQEEAEQLLSTINRIVQNTTYNGKSYLTDLREPTAQPLVTTPVRQRRRQYKRLSGRWIPDRYHSGCNQSTKNRPDTFIG